MRPGNPSSSFLQRSNREVAAFWNGTGPWRMTYFDWLVQTPPDSLAPALRMEREFVIREQDVVDREIDRSHTVVELGAGVGRSLLPALRRGLVRRVIAMDIAERQIALFREVAAGEMLLRRALPIVADVGSLPLASDGTDLVLVCNQTFGNFLGDTRTAVVEEVRRVLSRRGRLFVGGFTNVHVAHDCYAEWDVGVKSIDVETGFCRLEHYNSLWAKEADISALMARHGLVLESSHHASLGFMNVYHLDG